MRSFFKRPFLCLTATANKDTTSKLRSMLQLQNPLIFRKSPEKMNIKLKVSKLATHDYSYFEHMGEMLANKELVEKTIIYCYNTTELSEIYATLCEAALDHYPDDAFPVCMFHRCTPEKCKQIVLDEFSKQTSFVRIVVATCPLGMGVKRTAVTYMMLHCKSKAVEPYKF